MHDCREMRRIRTVQIHFAHEETVRVAVTTRSLRDTPAIGAFLRSLPEMEPTVEGHNQFSAYGNRMRIDYGEREDIVVSLQNGQIQAETMIHIGPETIEVAAKYSIYNGELYEDNVREATGENVAPAPPFTVHVLMINRELFNTTVCLQVNDNKYYMEWFNIECDKWAVVMSSQHMYNFRRGNPPPRAIANLAEFFRGRGVQNPPVTREATIDQVIVNETVDGIPLEQQAAGMEASFTTPVEPMEDYTDQNSVTVEDRATVENAEQPDVVAVEDIPLKKHNEVVVRSDGAAEMGELGGMNMMGGNQGDQEMPSELERPTIGRLSSDNGTDSDDTGDEDRLQIADED